MPKGEYEDTEKNRKLGLVGKSKNKWNAKGELRPARKSRAKPADRFEKKLEADIGVMPDIGGEELKQFATERRPEYLTKAGKVRKRAPRMKKDKRSTEELPESISVQVENILQPSTNAYTAVMGGQGFDESSNVAQNQALDFLNFINATMPEPTAEGQQNITMAIDQAKEDETDMDLQTAMDWLLENDKKKWDKFYAKEKELDSKLEDAEATLSNMLEDRGVEEDGFDGVGRGGMVDRRKGRKDYEERDEEIDTLDISSIVKNYRFSGWYENRYWRQSDEDYDDLDLDDPDQDLRDKVKEWYNSLNSWDWDRKFIKGELEEVRHKQTKEAGEDEEGIAKRKLRRVKYDTRDFTKKVVDFVKATKIARAGATSGKGDAQRTNFYFGTEEEEIRAGDKDPSLYASADPVKEDQRVGGLGELDQEALAKDREDFELNKRLKSVPFDQREYWKEYYKKNPSLLKKVIGRGRDKFINSRSLGIPLNLDAIAEPKTKTFRDRIIEGGKEVKTELTGAEQEDLFGRQFTQKEIDFGVPEELGYGPKRFPTLNKNIEFSTYRGKTDDETLSAYAYKELEEQRSGRKGHFYLDELRKGYGAEDEVEKQRYHDENPGRRYLEDVDTTKGIGGAEQLNEGTTRGHPFADEAYRIEYREELQHTNKGFAYERQKYHVKVKEPVKQGVFYYPQNEGTNRKDRGQSFLGRDRPVMRPIVPKIGVMDEAPWANDPEPVEEPVKPAERLKKIIKRKKKIKFNIVEKPPTDPDPDATPVADVPTISIEQITEAVEPQDVSSLFEEQTKGYLRGYASSAVTSKFRTLEEAQIACIANPNCSGVVYNRYQQKPYTIRKGQTLLQKREGESGGSEVTYRKKKV